MAKVKKVPKKYHPKGFKILHEDLDLIIGRKAPGYLTVGALWNRDDTIHSALNEYVRRGNAKSRKCVFVVHRLDQATSGVLVFAKSEDAQYFLKENWPETVKTYYTVVHGQMKNKSGTIKSYLYEDEDYHVYSSPHASDENGLGKFAETEYEVVAENNKFSLVKINLLTGRKNQIRVHMADEGHPIVGDNKYGKPNTPFKSLALHAYSIELTHPFSRKRLEIKSKPPEFFRELVKYDF